VADSRYRKQLGVTIPPASAGTTYRPGPLVRQPVPASAPGVESSAQPIVVQGTGWRFAIPGALLLSIASAVGARMIPTATSTDTELAGVRQDLRELRTELAQRARETDAKIETTRTELGAERNKNLIQDYQLEQLRSK
jgi:hypothetical protein